MSQSKKLLAVVAVMAVLSVILVCVSLFSGSSTGLRAGFNAEFLDRPDGYAGLKDAYDLQFSQPPVQMDTGLMYQACADGAVDVICGFATDGRIAAFNLVTLRDDRQFFPPYYAAPLVRAETLRRHPELKELLNRLAGLLTDETMQQLNYQVDRKDNPRKPIDVARDFLMSEGLIAPDAQPGTGSAGTIRVGGKDFTEQSILGELLAVLIECNTDLAVDRKLFLGGTMICFQALRAGDLDLYAEYTGTGLVNILKQPVEQDPDRVYDIVRQAFAEQFDLAWLQPLGFNNTYTVTMRRDQADALGIATVSDLAATLKAQ